MKTIALPVYAYVPENLDLSLILGRQSRTLIDYARYFVDLIFKGTHFADRATAGGYVNLKVAYLRKIVPKAIIGPLRAILTEQGVIQVDGRYIVGEKSKGYRLAMKYRTSPHRRQIIDDPKIAKRIRRSKAEQLNGLSDVHRHMHQQFKHIDINLTEMMAMIQRHEKALPADERGFCPTLFLAAEQLDTGDWLPKVCAYGRFHTPLTRLLSDGRAALSINGQRLVNLDIANSQPLFFGVVILQKLAHFWTSYRARTAALPDGAISTSISTGHRDTVVGDSPDIDLDSFDAGNSLPDDVHRYLDFVQNGRLYDHLADSSSFSRDSFKARLFRDVFYGHNSIYTDLTRAFETQFPTVYGHIKEFKRQNYRSLAWLMQRSESEYMVNGVCRRLMMDRPDITFLTIHDSVLTSPAHADTVKSIMLDEFAKLGLKPMIRTECC